MSVETVKAWRCDYGDCGHVWLAGDAEPGQCAKCRRRGWNRGEVVKVGPKVVAKVEKVKPRTVAQVENAEVFMMTCKRCDAVVLRDPKALQYWKCETCHRQLDEREVIEHRTTCKCWRCQQERMRQCGSATPAM